MKCEAVCRIWCGNLYRENEEDATSGGSPKPTRQEVCDRVRQQLGIARFGTKTLSNRIADWERERPGFKFPGTPADEGFGEFDPVWEPSPGAGAIPSNAAGISSLFSHFAH